MIKLQFEDDGSGSTLVAAAPGGFTVRIEREDYPSNPFSDWDCEPDLAVLSFGYGGSSDITEHGAGAPLNPFRYVTDSLLRRHMRAIAAAVDIDPADLDKEARDNAGRGDCLTSHKRDILVGAFDDLGNSDRLEAAAAIFNAIGIEALCTSSRGYCQRDYAELLVVATPEWAKDVGAPRDTHARQLEAAAKLYGYWAWGDVYFYTIESPEGEHVDSCSGFYTDDPAGAGFAESGMAEHVIPALESAIAARRAAIAAEMEAARPDMYQPA